VKRRDEKEGRIGRSVLYCTVQYSTVRYDTTHHTTPHHTTPHHCAIQTISAHLNDEPVVQTLREGGSTLTALWREGARGKYG
jgi:hypothetical protein